MPRKPSPGEQLRQAVSSRFDLDPHEVVLLDSAAATADHIAALQQVVDRDGEVSGEGRPHPALIELRLQRLTLGRLLARLRIPTEVDRPLQRRGPRGFYGVRSAS